MLTIFPPCACRSSIRLSVGTIFWFISGASFHLAVNALLFTPCMLSVVPLLLGKSLVSCHCFQHGAKVDICIHRMLKGMLMAGSNDTRDHSRGASTLAFDTRGNATRFRHSVHERQMRSLSLSLPSAHRDSLQLVAATPSAPSRQRHRLLAARVPHVHAPLPSL